MDGRNNKLFIYLAAEGVSLARSAAGVGLCLVRTAHCRGRLLRRELGAVVGARLVLMG